MNIFSAFLKRVPKVVWVCILTTLSITAVQSAFSYFFEYEDIVSYKKFYKYIQNLFLLNLLLGSFIFLAGCDIKRAVISCSIFLMGIFFLVFINRKLNCGLLSFNYLEPFNYHFISLLAIVLTCLIIILSKPCIHKRFFIVLAISFVCIYVCVKFTKFDFVNNLENQKIVYSKKGYLGLFYKHSVSEFFDSENVVLQKKRCDFINSGKKIVFSHVGKTGGCSVGYILKSAYSTISFVMPGPTRRFHSMTDLEKAELLSKYEFIHAHFGKKEMDNLPISKRSKVIFFRDPKKRLISLYYFLFFNGRAIGDKSIINSKVLQKVRNMSLLEFLKVLSSSNQNESFEGHSKHNHMFWENYYVKFLSGRDIDRWDIREDDIKSSIEYLKTFDFVGITENLDKDLERLSDYYYISKPQHKIKINSFEAHTGVYTEITGKKVIKEPITPEIDRELDRLTKYDYIIYNEAKKIRDEQARKWRAGEMKRAMGD